MKNQTVAIRLVVALVICLLLLANFTSICTAQQDNQRLAYYKERLENAIWDRDNYFNQTQAEYNNLINTVTQIASEKEVLAIDEYLEYLEEKKHRERDYEEESRRHIYDNPSRPGYRSRVTPYSLKFYDYYNAKKESGEDLSSADKFMKLVYIANRQWPDIPDGVDTLGKHGLGDIGTDTPHTTESEHFRQYFHNLSPEDRGVGVRAMFLTYVRRGKDMRSDEQREIELDGIIDRDLAKEYNIVQRPYYEILYENLLKEDEQYQALLNRIRSIDREMITNILRVNRLQDLVNQYKYVDQTSDVDYSDIQEVIEEVKGEREQESPGAPEGSNGFISNIIKDIIDTIDRIAQGGFGAAEPVEEAASHDPNLEMPGEWAFPRPYGDIYDSGHLIIDDLGDEYEKQPDGSWVATGENYGPLLPEFWPDPVAGPDDQIAVTIDGERNVVYTLEEGDQSVEHTFSALATEPGEYTYAWSFGDGRDYSENPGQGRRSGGRITYDSITEGKTLTLRVRLIDSQGEFLGSDQVTVSFVVDEEADDTENRQDILNVCGEWIRSGSGGAGRTITTYDISELPPTTDFDMRFNAMSIPDKFIVEYEGTVVYDSGWRGSSMGNPDLYPGGLSGGGQGEARAMFEKNNSNSFTVTVIGPEPDTAWNYELRANCPVVEE